MRSKARANKMNIVRCAYVDEDGLQCHRTSGTPYADGWGNPSLLRHGIDVGQWYCRGHNGPLGRDLHDDDKAA
jgi:hypothetical protein